jgi:PAS domain S-box-containing protein
MPHDMSKLLMTSPNPELLGSEQKFLLQSTALETAANGVLITDTKGTILWVNPAFVTLTGYTAEEVLGNNPRLLKSGKHDREFYKDLWKTILAGKTWRGNFTNRRKDGTLYHDEHTITPVRSKEGVITHFVAIMNDVTERKEAENQLLWKTAFLEAQVNSALDGILIVDKEGNKILQNQRMIDLWNIPREFTDTGDDKQLLEWVTAHVKNPRQFVEKVIYLYAHLDEVSRDEIELIDGRFFDRYSAPVLSKDGKYYGRIWTFRDITEQRRTEAQIAEQAALLDKAQDAILVRDLEGKILFWNKGAEHMHGWTRQEATGQNVIELYYSDPKKFKEANALTISLGEWHGELQHLTKDRGEITVEARWTLIRDNEGHPKSILAINTDITEKKKIEAQFMRAQRMESIGTLAGGIAHDLNNILAPIMMSIDILKTTSDSPETKQILETIEVSAKRGADIVRQVLSFARGLEGERVEIQPKHLLNDLEHMVKDTFPKDIQLQFSIPNDTWTILVDPTQVHQILLNLCVNARDAMPNGGDLTIGVENCVIDEQYAAMNIQAKAGRYVNISVTDSGTGIPPEILDKILSSPFLPPRTFTKAPAWACQLSWPS